MCVYPVQKPNVRWTWTPIDVCSSLYRLYSREASQTEIRRILRHLGKYFHLHEWHWQGRRQVCLQE